VLKLKVPHAIFQGYLEGLEVFLQFDEAYQGQNDDFLEQFAFEINLGDFFQKASVHAFFDQVGDSLMGHFMSKGEENEQWVLSVLMRQLGGQS
jgi:hypothetical protein